MATGAKPKMASFLLRLPLDLYADLRRTASKSERSAAAEIRLAIRRHVYGKDES